MGSYYERRARLNLETANLGELTSRDDFSRRDIIRAAYRLGREEKRLESVENKLSGGIKDKTKKEELVGQREIRMRYLPEESDETKTENPDQEDFINNRIESYQKELTDSGVEWEVRAFKNLNSKNRRVLIVSLFETESKIEAKKAILKETITSANPENICDAASEVKRLQLERKGKIADIKFALAEQKVEDSLADFDGVRHQIFEKTKRGFKNSDRVFQNLLATGREVVASKANVYGEDIRQAFSPAIEGMRQAREGVSETFTKITNKVDKVFIERVREKFSSSKSGVRKVIERLANTVGYIKTEAERTKIEIRREYYSQRHDIEVGFRQTTAFLRTDILAARKQLGFMPARLVAEFGGAIGSGTSDDEIKELENREDNLEVERNRLSKILIERAEEERSKNPYYERFRQDLRKAAVLNVNPPKEGPEVEIPEGPGPLLPEKVASGGKDLNREIIDYPELSDAEFSKIYDQSKNEFKDKEKKWGGERNQENQKLLDEAAKTYWESLVEANRRMNSMLSMKLSDSKIPPESSEDYKAYKEFNTHLEKISEEEERYYDKSEQIGYYEKVLGYRAQKMLKILDALPAKA
jgi:hypothetical protein